MFILGFEPFFIVLPIRLILLIIQALSSVIFSSFSLIGKHDSANLSDFKKFWNVRENKKSLEKKENCDQETNRTKIENTSNQIWKVKILLQHETQSQMNEHKCSLLLYCPFFSSFISHIYFPLQFLFIFFIFSWYFPI